MFTDFQRVLKFASVDFFRNIGRSISAIFVLTITISLVTGMFLVHGMGNFLIASLEDKIDITAYFSDQTPEEDIINVKNQIIANAVGIKSVEYVSKEDALADFTKKHGDNPVFLNALTEVGGNPFLPSLNITTSGSSLEYENVANILQSDQFSAIIESVDYSQKKATIDKIFSIVQGVNRAGLVLAAILMLVAILVVFNTIKLAIETSREEINTMRIIGASSWFVRSPFIIQGAVFGLISFVICFFATMILSYVFSPGLTNILSGFGLWGYFVSNIWLIMAIQSAFAIGLGVAASFIVVQKYLKV